MLTSPCRARVVDSAAAHLQQAAATRGQGTLAAARGRRWGPPAGAGGGLGIGHARAGGGRRAALPGGGVGG
eukprot:1184436-Prorocentrum_minimum.AAC.1